MIIAFSLILVFAACSDNDDDNNNDSMTMNAEMMANSVTSGAVDATTEIVEAASYVDGFTPDPLNLLRGDLDILSEPSYDSATGWWTYDTSVTYGTITLAVAESLQYKDDGGGYVMIPERANSFIWRNHYHQTQESMEWNYIYRIEYDGIDVEETGEDFSTVNGTGSWIYDISTDEGREEFSVNVIYNNIVIHWIDGESMEYPHSGTYTIEYGDWSAMTMEFDGDETAILTLTDSDGETWTFIINLLENTATPV